MLQKRSVLSSQQQNSSCLCHPFPAGQQVWTAYDARAQAIHGSAVPCQLSQSGFRKGRESSSGTSLWCRSCCATPTTLTRSATRSVARSQSLRCVASGLWVWPSPTTSPTSVSVPLPAQRGHALTQLLESFGKSTAADAKVVEQSHDWDLQIRANAGEGHQMYTQPCMMRLDAWARSCFTCGLHLADTDHQYLHKAST